MLYVIFGPPRHQNEVHRFGFSPLGDVLGGRPCELLRASWPPRRPRCPQELQRRLQEASQTPPETSQRHFGSDFGTFGGPKIVIFFIFMSQNRDREKQPPPFISYMLPSAFRTPKMCRKGPQNAPKMLANMCLGGF